MTVYVHISQDVYIRPNKSLWFLVSARVASDPRIGILNLFIYFFCYETMSELQPKLLDWLEFCGAVLNDFFTYGYECLPDLWGLS